MIVRKDVRNVYSFEIFLISKMNLSLYKKPIEGPSTKSIFKVFNFLSVILFQTIFFYRIINIH